MKHALLSSTSLASATAAATLASSKAPPSTAASLAHRPSAALIATSLAGMIAAAQPADAAVIYTVNGIKAGSPILSGSTVTGYTTETLYLGVGTGGLSTSPSPTVGYLLISPTTTASTYSATMTLARGDATKNVLISLSPISATAGWGATTNVGTINNPTPSLVSTFTYSPSATLTRGNSVTNTFQIFGSLSGGGSGAPTDTTNITLISNWVAPVQSTSATATQLYVLPGQSTTGTVTVSNIGDGNLAAPTGTNLGIAGSPYNLQGSVTSSAGTGFVVAPSGATLNLTDTKGSANAASSSATFTAIYTGTTRGAAATATISASFTNGSTANNNAGGQTATYTFTGQTVAPQASITATLNAGDVRVGTSTTVALTVQNTGDGNLAGKTSTFNLRGSVGGASGAFSGSGGTLNGATGLNDATYGAGATTSSSFTYTYAPTTRSNGLAQTSTVATSLQNGANTSNASGMVNTTLSGKAVGPVYQSKFTTLGVTTTTTLSANGPGTGTPPAVEVFGGTIMFGTGFGGLTQNLLISNISTDNAATKLTDLTLTSVTISSGTEYSFSLSGFDTGPTSSTTTTATNAVLHNAANAGGTGTIAIQFVDKAGTGTAQLRIATDENAALGGSGTIYVYNLAFSVPEPGTVMVFGAGLLGLAISRRTRRGKVEAARLTAHAESDPSPG